MPQPVPAVAPILGEPPVAPKPSGLPSPAFEVEAFPPAGLVIDTQDREAVRAFYRGVFFQSQDVPIGWTGNYATGDAGTTGQLFRDAVALRLNWYRALAGVPASISLYDPYNIKDQQAALMVSANGQLSHTPPSTWIYYTADGAEAAGNSNLALGSSGAGAMTGYMQDSGGNNALVGHRRWVLYPQTRTMGTGDVPGGTLNSASVFPANALWVFDGNFGTARPATRDGFVAWPPKGYVPYPVVFGRWSLSYPNADFSGATVTVSKGGNAIPVTIEYRSDAVSLDYGEDTIVWLLSGFNDLSAQPRPGADESYSVTVSGVQGPGVPPVFSYNVVVFDPDVVTPGAPLAIASAPATVGAAVAFAGSVGAMPGATGYQLDLYRSSALAGALTPGNSAASWTQLTSGYNALETTEFHLYHAAFETQQLTLGKILYVGQNASLSFDRRFGFATTGEVARVQVSFDGGVSWQDVHTEAGTGNPIPTETVTVNLSAFTGRMLRLRFSFTVTNSAFPCSDQCGWYFGNLGFNNVSELSLASHATLPSTLPSTNLVAADPGDYILLAQAEYQGTYFGDWGPGLTITATTADSVAPGVPPGVSAAAVSSTQVNVSWGASTDNIGVTQYKVYRNTDSYTTPIATVIARTVSYSNTGLTAATTYSYKVAACDAASNCSAQSASASATTLAAPDTTPDAFGYTAATGQTLSSTASSNAVTPVGYNAAAVISISGGGGAYRINGGAFSSSTGSISPGQSVQVRVNTAATCNTPTSTTLNIGGTTATFSATTLACDTTPDAFTFPAQTGVLLNTTVTSDAVTPTGYNAPTPISVTAGGSYSINGGAFTGVSGTLNNGDSVRVQMSSSASPNMQFCSTLTIGGVPGQFCTTTGTLSVEQFMRTFRILMDE